MMGDLRERGKFAGIGRSRFFRNLIASSRIRSHFPDRCCRRPGSPFGGGVTPPGGLAGPQRPAFFFQACPLPVAAGRASGSALPKPTISSSRSALVVGETPARIR